MAIQVTAIAVGLMLSTVSLGEGRGLFRIRAVRKEAGGSGGSTSYVDRLVRV